MGTAANHSLPKPEAGRNWERNPVPMDRWQIGRVDLFIFGMIGICAAVSWLGIAPRVGGVDLLAVTAVVAGGIPVYREALKNLAAGRMTMELSMTIAVIAALAVREFSTALSILFFILGAEILEELTVHRGRKAIANLLQLLPRRALVRRNGGHHLELPIEHVRAGDVVVIRPAAEIPVDGVVVQGHSTVDQSSITGESKPVEKVPGSVVFAGTTNHSGALEVRTDKLGRGTVFGRIIEALETAEHSPAPVQEMADRFAGWLVYFALASALATLVITHNIRSAIAVVIVAGACGIAAGTPLALLGAIGRAAQGGAIVKGARHLEALGTIDTVVLDKTGTLTFGEPYVTAIVPCPGVDPAEVLQLAAIAERPSEHPVARAILKEAARQKVLIGEPDAFTYLPGKGVRAFWNGGEILAGTLGWLSGLENFGSQLRTLPDECGDILVAYRGRLIGALRTNDVLRPEAMEAVARIRAMGIDTILLTGDSRNVAAEIARQLGVREFGAELVPEEKLRRVRHLIASGKRVALVGDGINDAPAVAEATVGIAMGSGTDLARHSAGVLLLGNNLADCAQLLATARRCRRIIYFNFAGTMIVDALGVVLAAIGILTPLPAAIVHVSSDMAFILNSARLVPASSLKRRL
jgi:Cd2+/Zn2+-exporting ATPase/Cu+-exporting ATPase